MAQPLLKKQLEIAGAERPSVPDLDSAVMELGEAKDQRQSALDRVREADARVLELLNEHELDAYLFVDGEFSHHVKRKTSTKLGYKRERDESDELLEGEDAGE
jgi:hypothetical protein